MEDYERQNSRAWDDDLKDVPDPVRAGEFIWTEPDVQTPDHQQPNRAGSTASSSRTARRVGPAPPSGRQTRLPPHPGPSSSSNGRAPLASPPPPPQATAGAGHAIGPSQQIPYGVPLEAYIGQPMPQASLPQLSGPRPSASGHGSRFPRPPPPPPPPPPPHPVRPHKPWQSSRGLPLKGLEPSKVHEVESTRENAGSKAWRARKAPRETVAVPSATAAHIREHLASLAQEAGCYLEVAKTGSLGLWGEPSNVRDARRRIESALGNDRGQAKARFAVLRSLTPALQKRAEHRFKNAVKRSRYRQIPPLGTAFDVIGIFHWPSKEYKPEDVLGPSYEALDPVRMDCKCYINYHSEINSFEVLGSFGGVQAALLRIRKACFQLTAQSINPVRLALTHWRSSIVPSHVSLESYAGPRVIATLRKDIEHVNQSPRGEGEVEDAKELENASRSSTLNVERVKITFANVLQKVHYYTGAITMVIRLGTFLLDQYMPPEDGLYELQEYENMTKESQFRGEVSGELGDVVTSNADVLPTIQAADDLLRPQDAMADDLKDVQPRFSAVFQFEDEIGDLRLVKSWHLDEETEAFASQVVEEKDRWTRLDRDTGKTNHLVDMALTDLHTGSAWQFDITATRAVDEDKIDQVYTNFAKRVRINLAVALRFGDECFVEWKKVIPLKAMRQEVHYRYNIVQTDYVLDLVRFQNRDFPAGQSSIKHLDSMTLESCWGLSVSRADWGTMFSKNERLPVGTHADWQDDMETWFPQFGYNDADGSDGFLQLVDKLAQIEKLFQAKPKQSPIGQTPTDANSKKAGKMPIMQGLSLSDAAMDGAGSDLGNLDADQQLHRAMEASRLTHNSEKNIRELQVKAGEAKWKLTEADFQADFEQDVGSDSDQYYD